MAADMSQMVPWQHTALCLAQAVQQGMETGRNLLRGAWDALKIVRKAKKMF